MEWLNPQYFWTLVGTPIVVLLLVYAAIRRKRSHDQIASPEVADRLMPFVSSRRRRWKAAMITAAILLTGFALIGPRFGSQIKEVKREGIDLIVALDVSLSMQAQDVAPNRLDRSRNEIKKLLDGLGGDRVGLVLFSGDAFLQCPLTSDYGAVRLFLDVANPSLIPTPGTDFGAALRTAIAAFENAKGTTEEARTQALLIISDGENHVPEIDELTEDARRAGIVVFSAGVGETEGVPIPVSRNRNGAVYKKDRQGQVVTTRLEEEVLQKLAEDGAYFRIAKTASSLPKITAALDRLEQNEFGTEEFEEYDEKYQWPLALAVFLLIAESLWGDHRRKTNRNATNFSAATATVTTKGASSKGKK